MPLLCISLLALLLLPLSLSCDSKRPPKEVRDDYRIIVQTDLNNANEMIATSLQNSPCPVLEHKLHNCTPGSMDAVSTTLHILTCKMKNLNISCTDVVVASIINSLRCPCPEKPTKDPNARSKRSAATRRIRNKRKISRRETKKLCKAKVILSAVTKCYQMLNTMLTDT